VETKAIWFEHARHFPHRDVEVDDVLNHRGRDDNIKLVGGKRQPKMLTGNPAVPCLDGSRIAAKTKQFAIFVASISDAVVNIETAEMRQPRKCPSSPSMSRTTKSCRHCNEFNAGSSEMQALFVPTKTPREIVGKISADTHTVLAETALKAKLAEMGYVAAPSSPEELGKLLRSEIARWSAVIKSVGITLD
jgi:hypothetical protein